MSSAKSFHASAYLLAWHALRLPPSAFIAASNPQGP